MATFQYVAMDAQGHQVRGEAKALDKSHLNLILEEQHLFLVSCEEMHEGPGKPAAADEAGPVKRTDDSPIKKPADYVIVVSIFIVFMLLGYWAGR